MRLNKLSAEQKVELSTIVSNITSDNMIAALSEQGKLTDADKHIIELCSAVSATAISIALQCLEELGESPKKNQYRM